MSADSVFYYGKTKIFMLLFCESDKIIRGIFYGFYKMVFG